nr:putative reverse transcriptase domain-containing protein [Tanacetum cinerariifolium]
PWEDPVDYLTDGGDDGDDEEGSSKDDEEDEDDDIDIEANEEEEEEHPAPADSVVIASTAADQAPSAEETEPFETDESAATPPPHPAYRMTARISIPALVPMPAWTDSEVVRLLSISSPPASPLSPWSSPPPQIPFPPLPSILSPPSPVLSPAPPPSPIRSLSYRAAMIRLRDEAASTSSPPLQLPSASRLRADYGFVATMDREIMRDPEREVVYGITDLWDEIVETLQGAPVADRKRQTMILELLRIDHMRSTESSELRTALQGQVTAQQGQVTALQAQVTTLQGQQGLAGELLSDYDCEIRYHPGKENVVADALSRKEREPPLRVRALKNYADLKRKPMEFQVGDKVMLKVSPWKGVVRFGKRGKLNPIVHNTFHVSNLKKYHADEPLAVPLDGLHFDDKLHFVEEPVEVVDRKVKRLKQS